MFNFIIVGGGFTGTVLGERIANILNKKVLIIERRNHIGGNCYDFRNKYGILVHKYGPHLFHTNNKEVWNYLSNFTDWRYYHHRVLAFIDIFSKLVFIILLLSDNHFFILLKFLI